MEAAEVKNGHSHTYGFLGDSLVGFNFQLQFIDQVLESGDVLAVLLSLEDNLFRQELQKPSVHTLCGGRAWLTTPGR